MSYGKSPIHFLYKRLQRGNSGSAAREKLPVTIDREYLEQLWQIQDGRCAVTGMAMTYTPKNLKETTGLNASLDRIDSSEGYVDGNVRIVCSRVNAMRGAGDDTELLWWCKQILWGLEGE